MIEIVCRFPVVEHFVTILNWRVECGETIGKEEDVEGSDWRKEVLVGRLPLGAIGVSSEFVNQVYMKWT